jgi:protoporphyrinogen oxidase
MIVILGAGLSGLSASYHLGHERCILLERNAHAFGHIASQQREGFSWDIGPHVSFTKNDYVKTLFERCVAGGFENLEVNVGNYFKGHWIDHPAQTALHQVPQPERDACLASFLQTRALPGADLPATASDYQQWLERAFGPVFASTFSAAYTRKYWTRPPCDLTTEWIGGRVLYPDRDDVTRGAAGPLNRPTHYITRVRYPKHGGYQSFAAGLRRGSRIRHGADVSAVDLKQREVWLLDGSRIEFDRLVNTLPLPVFIGACRDVPSRVAEAARHLSCTQLLLVNVAAPHESPRPEHWLYVYDEDKLSTRINFTEKLSQNNAPKGWTGVQTEVYFSRHRPLPATPQEVAARVEEELVMMGLVDPSRFPAGTKSHRHLHLAPWANVVFDHDTAPALDTIWGWLETHGLQREPDDLHPLTDWSVPPATREGDATLFMAGRFGQWKYYWTDDCVLRGKRISEVI